MRSRAGCAIGLCVLLCAAHARAAAPAAKTEARRHYEAGLASMEKRAYGEAIAELNQAYDLGHDFDVLYDIGRAYIAIDQPMFAVKALKKYLAEGGKHVSGQRRKEVEATIAEQGARIAKVTVRAPVAGAVIRVDGIEVGRTPLSAPLELGAGTHAFSAAADGYRNWEESIDLAGGEAREVQAELAATDSPFPGSASTSVVVVPPSPPPAPPPAPDPLATGPVPETTATTTATPAPAPFPTQKVAAYTLAGVGAAALIVGGIYGLEAISKRHDSNAACPQNRCTQAGVELNDQAKTAARVADVAIGVGLVSAAVATYLLLRPAPATQVAKASRLRVNAAVGPNQAAVALGGTW